MVDIPKTLRAEALIADEDWTGIYQISPNLAFAAAARIEKLEALVEQLRNDNSSMIDDYDTDFLRQEKRIEKLEAALREIINRAEFRNSEYVTDIVCRIARSALEGKDD